MARSCTKCGGLICEEPIPFTGVTAVKCVNCGKCEAFMGKTPEALAMEAVNVRVAASRSAEQDRARDEMRANAKTTRRRTRRARARMGYSS